MANIVGDITFGVGADTRGLDRSLDRLRAFGRTVDQIAKQQTGASQAVTRAYNAQEKAMRSATARAAEMQRAIRASSASPQQMASMLGQTVNSLNAYTRALSSGQLNSVQMTRATDRFGISMGKLKNTLSGLKPPTEPISKFSSVLQGLESSAILAAGPLSGLGSRVRAIGSIFNETTALAAGMTVGFTATAFAVGKLATGAVKASMEIDRINAAFVAATGDQVAANAEFNYTVGVARKLGLELQGTAKSYSLLAASTRGTKLEGQATRDIFEATAMASTALKLSVDDTSGILKAFTQMASKGTIQAEELRGQLGDRMPGAFNLMANALDVSTKKLGEMMKKGEVLSDDALPKLAKQMALVYGGPAAAAAENLQAKINDLGTAQLLFNNAFDEATGISDKWKSVIVGLTGILDFFTKNMQQIVQVAVAVAAGLTGIGAAFAIAFAAGKWMAAVKAVGALTKGMVAFNLIALANPVALAAIAAGLLVGAIAYKKYSDAVAAAAAAQRDASIATANEFIASQKRMVTASKQMTDAYITDVETQLQAGMAQIKGLDANLRELETRAKTYDGTLLGVDNKRLNKARDAYNAEGQRIITMQEQLKKLQAIREKALDPGDMPSVVGSSTGTPKLDKLQEAIQDLDIIKQRTEELNSLPDYWLMGTESLEAFNKALNNGKQLEAYEDKLIRAGASQEVIMQKMQEMSDALAAQDAAELRLKKIEERAKALEKFGGDSVDKFGTFLESLSDSTKDVSESFDDMVTSIISDLRRLAIQYTILEPLKEALFGTTGGSGSGGGLWGALSSAAGDFIGGLFGGYTPSFKVGSEPPPSKPTLPGRARGGRVVGGEAYMVGERGPEPFIPGTSGRIVSNENAFGNGGINLTIINNSKAQISTRTSNNGMDLEVMVDDMVAKNLSNPSSRSSKAMRGSGNMIVGR